MKEFFSRIGNHLKTGWNRFRAAVTMQEELPENDLEAYRVRIRNHRRAVRIRTMLLILFAAILIGLLIFLVRHHRYADYEIRETYVNETAGLTSDYLGYQGMVLRCSGDGGSLMREDLSPVWNVAFDMASPAVEVCGDAIAFYDRNGTGVYICGRDGLIGNYTVPSPVTRLSVSQNGSAAVILSDGASSRIEYYTAQGSLIAEISTSFDDPGYPMDVALSPDGTLLLASYLTADGTSAGSRLIWYNFGTSGASYTDHISATSEFLDVLIPKVAFLNDRTSVAFRENGFTVFHGKDIPVEENSVDFEEEILSIFHDEKYLGFVFSDPDGEDRFLLRLYNSSGKRIRETGLESGYDRISIENGRILFFNSSELAVYTRDGICKYSGPIHEGGVECVVKTGRNRYLLMKDGGSEIVRLK